MCHDGEVLTVPHLSIKGGRLVAVTGPDLRRLEGVVADRILDAMRVAAAQLDRLGVRHALVGGLAVGAHGHPRATRDVDFLVGPEAFEVHAGGLVTMKPGVPIQVAGVTVDCLSIGEDEGHLEAALGQPVAPAEALAYLKLKSPRSKDRSDLVELVKAGFDTERVRAYLAAHAPELLPKLDDVIRTARAEEE
jgi:hypothetical protein